LLTRIVAVIFAILTVGVAHAAEIYRRGSGDETQIVIKGPMLIEDVEKFRAVLSSVAAGTVILQSDGGSAYAGIEIGKAIRMRGLTTRVTSQDGPCLSACAFAWLAGTPRSLTSTAQIGFHAAYEIVNGQPIPVGAGNALIGAYLRDIGLSDDAIYFVTQARPDQLKWLTESDAKSIGLAVKVVNDRETAEPSLLLPRVERGNPEVADWFLPRGDLPVPAPAPRKETSFEKIFVARKTADGRWALAFGYLIEGDPVDLHERTFKTIAGCRAACEAMKICMAFSYNERESDCYLRSRISYAAANDDFKSGFDPRLNVEFRE